jgi:hypothetical protein
MRKILLTLAGLAMFAVPAVAQTADEIVAKYVQAVGGMDKIAAIKTLKRSGKFIGGGGFEAVVSQETQRPNMVREEFVIQNLTGVNAYDGHTGWKIEPWQGKKDPEALGEEELKSIVEDADFDGPLVDWKKKGNKLEYLGHDDVEGTDTFKLRVTEAGGTVFTYYIDSEFNVPIKIDTKRTIRGTEREYETVVGDYKKVAGVYIPFSFESSAKGSPNASKTVFGKIEANVPINDVRFHKPAPKVLEARP